MMLNKLKTGTPILQFKPLSVQLFNFDTYTLCILYYTEFLHFFFKNIGTIYLILPVVKNRKSAAALNITVLLTFDFSLRDLSKAKAVSHKKTIDLCIVY